MMDGLKWWCLATSLALAKTFRVFTRSCLSAGRVNFLIHSALRSIFNPAICASPVFCSTTTATTPAPGEENRHFEGTDPPVMNVTSPVASEVTSVEFNIFSTEEIHAVSVKQIVNPVTFASTAPGKVPVPLPGGLYDPALGASDSLRQR
jgi:hypothetical protein